MYSHHSISGLIFFKKEFDSLQKIAHHNSTTSINKMKNYIIKAARVKKNVGWIVRDVYKTSSLEKAKDHRKFTDKFLKAHFPESYAYIAIE